MIDYDGIPLSVEDALDLLAGGHSPVPFRRFDPTNPDLVWIQHYLHLADAMPPPDPSLPIVSSFVAAGADLCMAYEAHHERERRRFRDHPMPVSIERYTNATGVEVGHYVTRTPALWPRGLTTGALTAVRASLGAWVVSCYPWELPRAFSAVWRPLIAICIREESRRTAQAAARRRRARSGRLDTRTLVEVIGETVALEPRGRRYIGRCPFHDDRNPSLSVDPDRGWYCYVCGEGGHIGAWIRRLRGA